MKDFDECRCRKDIAKWLKGKIENNKELDLLEVSTFAWDAFDYTDSKQKWTSFLKDNSEYMKKFKETDKSELWQAGSLI